MAGLRPLVDAEDEDGVKARRLSELFRLGVGRPPPGFVAGLDELDPVQVERACGAVGCGFPVAVRLSPVGLALHEEVALSSIGLRVAEGPSEVARAARELAGAAEGLLGRDIKFKVIVQQLVSPDASGAAYTVSPVTWREVIIVEGVPGVADVFMSVGSPHDSFTFSYDFRLLERRVMEKRYARAYVSGRGLVNVPLADPWAPCATDEAAGEVARAAARVKEMAGSDVEVEWALKDGRLYLLGYRPLGWVRS